MTTTETRPERIAIEARLRGPQRSWVEVMNPPRAASSGVLAVRVGAILLMFSDREALECWQDALDEARSLADLAYGPPSLTAELRLG